MRKRMVSAALALCLALTLFSGTALAAGEHPFTDVPQGHWAGDAVQYVYENNLMGGTDSTTFSPNNTTTRGMIVTVLYRLTGEPASGTASQFTDVAAGAWYAKAVAWAASRDCQRHQRHHFFPQFPHHPGAAGGDLLPLCPGPGMGRVRLD